VVRLRAETGATSEDLVGQVEEVDTGRAIWFHSAEELVGFLRHGSDRKTSSFVVRTREEHNKKTG